MCSGFILALLMMLMAEYVLQHHLSKVTYRTTMINMVGKFIDGSCEPR